MRRLKPVASENIIPISIPYLPRRQRISDELKTGSAASLSPFRVHIDALTEQFDLNHQIGARSTFSAGTCCIHEACQNTAYSRRASTFLSTIVFPSTARLDTMSIRDRASNLDPGQDGAIVREDAEADSQRIGEGGGHQHNSAEQEVEPDEVAGGREQDEAPASAPPPSVNAADAKKIFGTMRRPNPTVKKSVKNACYIMCRISWGAK